MLSHTRQSQVVGGPMRAPIGALPSTSTTGSCPGLCLHPQATAPSAWGPGPRGTAMGQVRTSGTRSLCSLSHLTLGALPVLVRGLTRPAQAVKVSGSDKLAHGCKSHSCSPRGRQKYSCSLKVSRQLSNAWPLTLAASFSEKQSKFNQA